MLIKLEKLCSKYNIREFGVLHIGAHHAEERADYQTNNARRILWVEANPDLANQLKEQISIENRPFEREDVINAVILDIDGREMEFNIANNTQSSSLLEFGTHKKSYPTIDTERTIKVITKRIDTIASDHPDLFDNLDFANLDVQGVEFAALKGFGKLLDQFKWIYTEVNRREVYKKNGMIWDIDSLLLGHNFFRKKVVFTNAGWGDAFYQKQSEKSQIYIFLYKIRVRCEYILWRVVDFLPFKKGILKRLKRHIKNRTKRRTQQCSRRE